MATLTTALTVLASLFMLSVCCLLLFLAEGMVAIGLKWLGNHLHDFIRDVANWNIKRLDALGI